MRKRGKKRRVSYELIARDSVVGHPMYELLDDLVCDHHAADLHEARIRLAWCTSWKPDVDGKVTIGKAKKASDLDRELADVDFVILLSKGFWQHHEVTAEQRAALLDHELCHCRRKFDDNGEPVEDERGRGVYRLAKHDIEEFTAIVSRHGCYKADLEEFARALRRKGVLAFKPCEVCIDSPGWVAFVDDHGVARLKRCACWVQWAEQRQVATA